MEKTTYIATIAGIRPLLMHNGQLADPLNPMTQRLSALTGKRKKTLEDHEAISRAEWEGGLYLLDGKVIVPADMIDAAIRDGAKVQRKGKAMVAGVEIEDDVVPLKYDGPQKWADLFDYKLKSGARPFVERRGARVQNARVIRTRPRFQKWSLTFRIARYEFAAVGEKDIRAALEFAGYAVGIGDFRPRYGLFAVDSFAEAK